GRVLGRPVGVIGQQRSSRATAVSDGEGRGAAELQRAVVARLSGNSVLVQLAVERAEDLRQRGAAGRSGNLGGHGLGGAVGVDLEGKRLVIGAGRADHEGRAGSIQTEGVSADAHAAAQYVGVGDAETVGVNSAARAAQVNRDLGVAGGLGAADVDIHDGVEAAAVVQVDVGRLARDFGQILLVFLI